MASSHSPGWPLVLPRASVLWPLSLQRVLKFSGNAAKASSPLDLLWLSGICFMFLSLYYFFGASTWEQGYVFVYMCVSVCQGFLTSAPLTFGAGSFSVLWSVWYPAACAVASPASTLKMPLAPSPTCDSQSCLQMVPDVLWGWGVGHLWLRIAALYPTKSSSWDCQR